MIHVRYIQYNNSEELQYKNSFFVVPSARGYVIKLQSEFKKRKWVSWDSILTFLARVCRCISSVASSINAFERRKQV